MGTMEPDTLPPSRPGAWKLVFAGFALLAVVGLTLTFFYRNTPRKTGVVEKTRKKNAQRVAFTLMLSPIGQQNAAERAAWIVNDIGADSLTTDLVVASTVSDPWCSNIGEYRSTIEMAGRNTRELRASKQAELLSMVAGLLTKSTLPSTLYICGSINANDLSDIGARTKRTAEAMRLRSSLSAPVRVVNLMEQPNSAVHREYMSIFSAAGVDVIEP